MEPEAPHHFLIVDDDELVTHCLSRVVRDHGVVHAAATLQGARELLAARAVWRAFFLDVALPDGNGLEFLAQSREDYPDVPVLVLTGHVDDRVVNAAFDLRPTCVVAKPYETHRIRAFLKELASANDEPRAVLEAFAARHGLSASEVDILQRLAAGETPEEIALKRGTSVLTVRKQIALLRARTGDASTQSLIIRALRPELWGSVGPSERTT